MAIVNMDLPCCDKCGEVWLPQKGPARANPRESARRCGKCKNINWDKDYREANPEFHQAPEELEEEPGKPRTKCQHGSLACKVCHKAIR